MIAEYMIKINGKWYQPGEKLPADRKPTIEPVRPKEDFTLEDVMPKENPITRKEIEEMKYFALKALAAKHGISADGKKFGVLRDEVIKALGL